MCIRDRDATDEEVIAAARLANCEEFAVKLPDGFYSMIVENGCELSGGERQRISIARAFLKMCIRDSFIAFYAAERFKI